MIRNGIIRQNAHIDRRSGPHGRRDPMMAINNDHLPIVLYNVDRIAYIAVRAHAIRNPIYGPARSSTFNGMRPNQGTGVNALENSGPFRLCGNALYETRASEFLGQSTESTKFSEPAVRPTTPGRRIVVLKLTPVQFNLPAKTFCDFLYGDIHR
jgi:hypothetical protein